MTLGMPGRVVAVGSRLLLSCVVLAAAEDWRHVDLKLPFDEAFLSHKAIRPKGDVNKMGGTLGLPLVMGWATGRLGQLAARGGAAMHYAHHSSGNFCSNRGYPFIFESDDGPEECLERCTEMPTCMFFTAYGNGWCQLSSRCVEEHPAGDGSAMTFQKKLPVDVCGTHSPAAHCFGEFAAPLGKSIRPRQLLPTSLEIDRT
eukprot:TRINITY_DN94110_c0_g1_i1.p1 TRINITY_DN94110_c0_g1~~TRINITY_DN94110_c0_g1_i1.p1  ORF type:complete len:201 (+),score=48.57 TRINITY_DN94110_c0_g1_i1:107-709(+)